MASTAAELFISYKRVPVSIAVAAELMAFILERFP